MRRLSALAAVAATVAALSLGLAGCSGSGQSASGAGTNQTPLTIAAFDPPTIVANYNPFSPMTEGFLKAMLYPPLWGYNVLKGGQVEYFLAKDFSWSPDAKTITIHLNPNLTWSDGSKLTAQDVAFSFRYAEQNALTPLTFASISTPDDATVVASFAAPSRSREETIASINIVPQSVWQHRKPLSGTNLNPITSGPYTVQKASSQMIQLTARPGFFKPVPVHTVQLVIANQDMITQQLLTGEVQWTAAGIANEQKNYVDVNPKTNHIWVMKTAEKGLSLNTQKAPFNNVDVRKGLSLALDRQKIANSYNPGWDKPVTATGLWSDNAGQWIPDRDNYTVKQDTKAALAEFAKAGYTHTGGKLIGPDGKQLTMTALSPNYPDGITYNREMVNQLKAIGINVSLQVVPAGQFTTDMKSGKFDIAMVNMSYDFTPYGFYSGLIGKTGLPPNGSNYGRWNDPATEAAFNEYLTATTTGQQHAAMDKVADIMVNQLPYIPLMTDSAVATYSSAHWTGWPDASNPYAMSVPWGSAIDTLNTVLNLKPAS